MLVTINKFSALKKNICNQLIINSFKSYIIYASKRKKDEILRNSSYIL